MTHADGFLAPPWRSAEVHNCPAHAQPAEDLQHSAVSRVQGRDSSAGTWSSANLPNGARHLSHACPDRREKLEQDISRASGQVQAQPLARLSVEQSDLQRDHNSELSSRKRRKVSIADEQKLTVLIWDVDETLVLFLSLLDGSFARAFNMQVASRHTRLAPIHLVNKVHSSCQGLVVLLANILGRDCVTLMKSVRSIHMLFLASGPVAVLRLCVTTRYSQQDTSVALQLGERWQDAIMDLCDDELLFTQARCLAPAPMLRLLLVG